MCHSGDVALAAAPHAPSGATPASKPPESETPKQDPPAVSPAPAATAPAEAPIAAGLDLLSGGGYPLVPGMFALFPTPAPAADRAGRVPPAPTAIPAVVVGPSAQEKDAVTRFFGAQARPDVAFKDVPRADYEGLLGIVAPPAPAKSTFLEGTGDTQYAGFLEARRKELAQWAVRPSVQGNPAAAAAAKAKIDSLENERKQAALLATGPLTGPGAAAKMDVLQQARELGPALGAVTYGRLQEIQQLQPNQAVANEMARRQNFGDTDLRSLLEAAGAPGGEVARREVMRRAQSEQTRQDLVKLSANRTLHWEQRAGLEWLSRDLAVARPENSVRDAKMAEATKLLEQYKALAFQRSPDTAAMQALVPKITQLNAEAEKVGEDSPEKKSLARFKSAIDENLGVVGPVGPAGVGELRVTKDSVDDLQGQLETARRRLDWIKRQPATSQTFAVEQSRLEQLVPALESATRARAPRAKTLPGSDASLAQATRSAQDWQWFANQAEKYEEKKLGKLDADDARATANQETARAEALGQLRYGTLAGRSLDEVVAHARKSGVDVDAYLKNLPLSQLGGTDESVARARAERVAQPLAEWRKMSDDERREALKSGKYPLETLRAMTEAERPGEPPQLRDDPDYRKARDKKAHNDSTRGFVGQRPGTNFLGQAEAVWENFWNRGGEEYERVAREADREMADAKQAFEAKQAAAPKASGPPRVAPDPMQADEIVKLRKSPEKIASLSFTQLSELQATLGNDPLAKTVAAERTRRVAPLADDIDSSLARGDMDEKARAALDDSLRSREHAAKTDAERDSLRKARDRLAQWRMDPYSFRGRQSEALNKSEAAFPPLSPEHTAALWGRWQRERDEQKQAINAPELDARKQEILRARIEGTIAAAKKQPGATQRPPEFWDKLKNQLTEMAEVRAIPSGDSINMRFAWKDSTKAAALLAPHWLSAGSHYSFNGDTPATWSRRLDVAPPLSAGDDLAWLGGLAGKYGERPVGLGGNELPLMKDTFDAKGLGDANLDWTYVLPTGMIMRTGGQLTALAAKEVTKRTLAQMAKQTAAGYAKSAGIGGGLGVAFDFAHGAAGWAQGEGFHVDPVGAFTGGATLGMKLRAQPALIVPQTKEGIDAVKKSADENRPLSAFVDLATLALPLYQTPLMRMFRELPGRGENRKGGGGSGGGGGGPGENGKTPIAPDPIILERFLRALAEEGFDPTRIPRDDGGVAGGGRDRRTASAKRSPSNKEAAAGSADGFKMFGELPGTTVMDPPSLPEAIPRLPPELVPIRPLDAGTRTIPEMAPEAGRSTEAPVRPGDHPKKAPPLPGDDLARLTPPGDFHPGPTPRPRPDGDPADDKKLRPGDHPERERAPLTIGPRAGRRGYDDDGDDDGQFRRAGRGGHKSNKGDGEDLARVRALEERVKRRLREEGIQVENGRLRDSVKILVHEKLGRGNHSPEQLKDLEEDAVESLRGKKSGGAALDAKATAQPTTQPKRNPTVDVPFNPSLDVDPGAAIVYIHNRKTGEVAYTIGWGAKREGTLIPQEECADGTHGVHENLLKQVAMRHPNDRIKSADWVGGTLRVGEKGTLEVPSARHGFWSVGQNKPTHDSLIGLMPPDDWGPAVSAMSRKLGRPLMAPASSDATMDNARASKSRFGRDDPSIASLRGFSDRFELPEGRKDWPEVFNHFLEDIRAGKYDRHR